jgi:hypothetical protein
MRDEISTFAAPDPQCGFIWINQPGADRDQFSCVRFEIHFLGLGANRKNLSNKMPSFMVGRSFNETP